MKPGPQPEYGGTRKTRGCRLTDECFEWTQSIGGPGFILQNLYEIDEYRLIVEQLMVKILNE